MTPASLLKKFIPKTAFGTRVGQAFLPVTSGSENLGTDRNVCPTLLCNARIIAVFRFIVLVLAHGALVTTTALAGPALASPALANADLQFSGRLQIQYVNVATSDDNNSTGAAYSRVSHAYMRRFYVGARGTLGANWSANLTYDLAGGGSFDRATINWSGSISNAPFSFDIGLRKVNFSYDEFTSSGSIKAIERSGSTRYFADDANGRRLGAASYRIGLFADYNPAAFAGKTAGFFAGAALTNAERQSAVSEISDTAGRSLNKPAVWLNIGHTGKTKSVTCILGAAAGCLPGMGGTGRTANNIGNPGQNILQGGVYADVTAGLCNIVAEYLVARVDKGVAAIGAAPARNATVSGFWIQPSFNITGKWQVVARYSHTDTGGRGIRVSDGVRAALAAVPGRALHECYIGANYYILGNDLKLQFGFIGGQTSGALTPGGAHNKETASGFRTQVQVNF